MLDYLHLARAQSHTMHHRTSTLHPTICQQKPGQCIFALAGLDKVGVKFTVLETCSAPQELTPEAAVSKGHNDLLRPALNPPTESMHPILHPTHRFANDITHSRKPISHAAYVAHASKVQP